MPTLEQARTELSRLPLLVHTGLVVLALGGIADIVVHLSPASHAGELVEHNALELAAHLTGFVGMVVILLGVVIDGTRQTRRHPTADE